MKIVLLIKSDRCDKCRTIWTTNRIDWPEHRASALPKQKSAGWQ